MVPKELAVINLVNTKLDNTKMGTFPCTAMSSLFMNSASVLNSLVLFI